MKMSFRRSAAVLLSVFLLSVTVPSQAQTPVGFDFLRAFVGARPSAMAGAFVAISGDIHNLVYNPAGATGLDRRQGTLSYLNHLLDFQSAFLAYAQPFATGTAGISLHYFDYGQFAGRDENNLDIGEFGANSLTLAATYSRKIRPNFSLGGSGKFIRFQIDNLSTTALAFDVGLIYEIPNVNWSFGAGVFNLGTTTSAFIESKDDLPLNFQIGAAKRLEHLPLMISAAFVKFKGESIDFRFGGEFTLTEQLFLRLGYDSVGQDQKVDTGKDRLAGVSLGMGLKVNSFDIDYSFSSFGEVGSLNRVTLVGRF